VRKKHSGVTRQSATGSPFHVLGPATEKERHYIIAVRERWIKNSARSADRRSGRRWTPEMGQQRSCKYMGTTPSMKRQTNAETL
jgi:hypothetical protein